MTSSNSKKCIILVGTTGTGKSTMVKNLTGINVKTSSSHRSCTSKSTLYSINSNIKILDTVGCEDSSGKPTSSILNELVQFLGPRNLNNIQVLWMINPNSKATPEVKKQARWINKLHRNIWKCTFILCKMGTNSNAFKGALGCVVAFSDDVPKHYNLYLLDEVPHDDTVKELASELNTNKRHKKGYFYNHEIKHWVLDKLTGVSKCRLTFVRVHTGKKIRKKYHWGTYSYKLKQVTGAVLGNVFTLGLINLGSGARGDMYYYYWDCCNSTKQYNSECRSRFNYWSCCKNKNEYSTGCGWKVYGA